MLSHPMTRPRRALLIATLLAATAGGVAACGEEGIDVPPEQRDAAALFVERVLDSPGRIVVSANTARVLPRIRNVWPSRPSFFTVNVSFPL